MCSRLAFAHVFSGCGVLSSLSTFKSCSLSVDTKRRRFAGCCCRSLESLSTAEPVDSNACTKQKRQILCWFGHFTHFSRRRPNWSFQVKFLRGSEKQSTSFNISFYQSCELLNHPLLLTGSTHYRLTTRGSLAVSWGFSVWSVQVFAV